MTKTTMNSIYADITVVNVSTNSFNNAVSHEDFFRVVCQVIIPVYNKRQ